MISTGLANIILGGKTNRMAALPFTAQHTWAVAVRSYRIDADPPGYSGGLGGTIGVGIWIELGGVPVEPLTEGTDYVDPDFPAPSSKRGYFPLSQFPPARLRVGQLYYVVFENLDPAPAENYQSLDLLVGPSGQVTPPVLWKDASGGWEVAAVGTPPVAGVFTTSPLLVCYANGQVQGNAGCEVEGGKIIGAYEYGWPTGLPL